jgi:hypothetical protein
VSTKEYSLKKHEYGEYSPEYGGILACGRVSTEEYIYLYRVIFKEKVQVLPVLALEKKLCSLSRTSQ